MPRHNKQYANKQTKRNAKFITNLKASFFILVILSLIFSYILDITNNNNKPVIIILNQAQIDIKDLSIYNIKTENEKIAYLSAIHATKKHLNNYSKEIQDNAIIDLVAIAHQENRNFNYNIKGSDEYLSSGLYQISRYYHPEITEEQQNDPYFSADWTLARMINNGYLTQGGRDISIMLHNGTPNTKATLKYLKEVNQYLAFINN